MHNGLMAYAERVEGNIPKTSEGGACSTPAGADQFYPGAAGRPSLPPAGEMVASKLTF
jgi:hypothetical protein